MSVCIKSGLGTIVDHMSALEPAERKGSPLEQGSVVPIGWRPSMSKPVPVVRCIVIKKDGVRCGRWSMRGHVKCRSHLGNAMNFANVREHTEAVLEAARLRLVDGADLAIDTIEDLMQPGTADAVRLKAATEVLDRNGIRGGIEVQIDVVGDNDPAKLLQSRLKTLRERGRQAQALQAAEPGAFGGLIGELVPTPHGSADPGQDTLF